MPGPGDEAVEFGPVGEMPVHEQKPHLFEGAGPRELDGGVLPVVVETLVTPDITDLGVGDDDVREAGRRDQHSSHGCNDHPLIDPRQC